MKNLLKKYDLRIIVMAGDLRHYEQFYQRQHIYLSSKKNNLRLVTYQRPTSFLKTTCSIRRVYYNSPINKLIMFMNLKNHVLMTY